MENDIQSIKKIQDSPQGGGAHIYIFHKLKSRTSRSDGADFANVKVTSERTSCVELARCKIVYVQCKISPHPKI